MKAYEVINKLKGTTVTLDEIKKWSYMNRVYPCALDGGLELNCEYPNALYRLVDRVCCKDVEGDCDKCLDIYFDSEVEFEESECPGCGWYASEDYYFDPDVCLCSYNHHCGNPADGVQDWTDGAEYWTEKWKCPVCGEVFEIECSN